MSEFIKALWRERLGIGPGDKFTANDGFEYFVSDIRENDYGIAFVFESTVGNEHGTLYNLFCTITDWNKTTLFNGKGQILGKCKRNYLDDPRVLGYEVIFTPKHHKIKAYIVRTPGVDCGAIKYTPKEFEEQFEIVEAFKGD